MQDCVSFLSLCFLLQPCTEMLTGFTFSIRSCSSRQRKHDQGQDTRGDSKALQHPERLFSGGGGTDPKGERKSPSRPLYPAPCFKFSSVATPLKLTTYSLLLCFGLNDIGMGRGPLIEPNVIFCTTHNAKHATHFDPIVFLLDVCASESAERVAPAMA